MWNRLRTGDVIGLGGLIVVIFITLIIGGELQSVTETLGENEPASVLFEHSFNGLSLASTGIIIVAAVGILVLVMGTLKSPIPSKSLSRPTPTISYEREEEEIETPNIWECQYCKHVNNWTDRECFFCGAPRKRSLR